MTLFHAVNRRPQPQEDEEDGESCGDPAELSVQVQAATSHEPDLDKKQGESRGHDETMNVKENGERRGVEGCLEVIGPRKPHDHDESGDDRSAGV